MNTIADKLRARAQEIRARMPGYEIFRSDGELAIKLHDDASYLEEVAEDLDADERKIKEDVAEERAELEDEIRDLKNEIEKLKEDLARADTAANASY